MKPDDFVSRHVQLGDVPRWELLSADELERLERLSRTLIDPVVDTFGPVTLTSYRHWSSGEARTGGHALGALDFVPQAAPIPLVFAWMAVTMGPAPGRAAWYGELIDERTHIHVTLPGVGGNGETLVEYEEGEYAAVDPTAARPSTLPNGAPWPPLELEGIVARVSGPRLWLALGLLGVLLLGMGSRR